MEASLPSTRRDEARDQVAQAGREAGGAPGTGGNGAQAPRGALPNLVILGAQKCGTSGLHYYLSLHPEVSMSRPKELNFFIEERNWGRGVDWYRRHFDAGARVRGEASPNYTAYPQHVGVPERMRELVPDAKLVYIVRDPLERIAAHWVHNYAKRREKGDLRATLMHPNTSYIARSQYYMQLQEYLRHFPREQILVLDQSDLRTARAETLRRVFEFVGADPDFTHPRFERERHQTARKLRASRWAVRLERASRTRTGRILPKGLWLALDEKLPLRRPIERPDVAAALDDEVLRVLREDAERLRELTGRTFEHWSLWQA
jgi:Sulfotransferase domain